MPESKNLITIVGDRFAGYATVPGVCTASQLLDQLARSAKFPPTTVRAGQGVSEEQWDQLTGYAHRRGYDEILTFQHPDFQLAGTSEAHKHRAENTLIANLEDRGNGLYAAALRVHNDNELLLDHQTGMHVQGMVSVEAARQMFLAATERYIASAHPDVPYYYVINAMNTTFENFLFPTDAEIQLEVLSAQLDNPDRLTLETDISIHQAGRRSTSTYVSYTAFNADTLAPVEHNRAVRAAGHLSSSAEAPTCGTRTPHEPTACLPRRCGGLLRRRRDAGRHQDDVQLLALLPVRAGRTGEHLPHATGITDQPCRHGRQPRGRKPGVLPPLPGRVCPAAEQPRPAVGQDAPG